MTLKTRSKNDLSPFCDAKGTPVVQIVNAITMTSELEEGRGKQSEGANNEGSWYK